MPLPVQEPGQRQHPQARQGIQGRHPQAVEGGRGIAFAGEAGVAGGEAGVDLHDGGEDVEAERLAVDTHQELLGYVEDQTLQKGGEEIQQQIQGREGEDVPRQHGAQGGHAEEGHRQEDHGQDGVQHRRQMEEAPADGQQAPQETGHGVGDEEHGQTGEGVGDEQAGTVHRQGVEQADGAGVIQVSPHQHGAEDGIGRCEAGGEERHRVVQRGGKLLRRKRQAPAGNVEQLQQDIQRDHGPRRAQKAPQGPGMAQVPPEQGPVKEGSL